MKKLTAVAIAVLVASQAQATEVIKNDTTSLDLYGRAYAGQVFGSKGETQRSVGSNEFVRIGATGETAVDGSLKAIGTYELQYNVNPTNESDPTLKTRYAFAGLKDFWGQATFGRQKGAISDITDWTDKALSDGYGNEALGMGTDKFATGRGNSVLKYAGSFDQFKVSASYKFDTDSTDDNTNTSKTAPAYGAAISYAFPMHITVGTGYNVGKLETSGETNNAKLWVAGVKYDDKAFYAALNISKGTDYTTEGTDIDGVEAAVGYDFTNGVGLMALYNKQTQKTDGSADVDTQDYYTLGAQYKFNKNLRVIGEYRINNLDDYKNDMQFAVRYDF